MILAGAESSRFHSVIVFRWPDCVSKSPDLLAANKWLSAKNPLAM
jgi:hypothetical protein